MINEHKLDYFGSVPVLNESSKYRFSLRCLLSHLTANTINSEREMCGEVIAFHFHSCFIELSTAHSLVWVVGANTRSQCVPIYSSHSTCLFGL